ncbi:TetR family transcriptional regulator [Paenibacillus sp. LMG 31459]|uniref:TetR family transcriptional regulator n=1 Tax=Paenibacillus phytohabitans TaxID=2654978 RepID=A0ABX1YKX1_9BACL|nr:TetR/AcrR family transcriptional regulator [Paenibacillus phytohabitans]NOU80994.1 TetR family transcriptional regulator [Paenibacillus phytohabitans]
MDDIKQENQPKGGRRRGEVLEQAILQAAWEELGEAGYARLTMEGIAVRAQTNKTALYRRWPNKAKIVAAAIKKHMPKTALAAPDSGDLRTDMLQLFESFARPLQGIGAETIHGLLVEYHGDNLIALLPKILPPKSGGKLNAIMRTILENAEKRGEVRLDRIPDRVIMLPADLFRYELLTTHEPVSDETITGIIDDIFLPLVRIR